MAEPLWSLRPPREQVAEDAPKSVHRSAQMRLARTVEGKLTQGYQIESQSDTQAVLVKGPRRWLGITLPGRTTRAIVSLDQRGYPTINTP